MLKFFSSSDSLFPDHITAAIWVCFADDVIIKRPGDKINVATGHGPCHATLAGAPKKTGRELKVIKDFKEFALKGNIIDLAVGIIIGGAFGKIVSSLVNDILMPALGVLLGGVDFTGLKYVITPSRGEVTEVAIMYGAFIQSVVDFLIISFSIFMLIKLLLSMKKKETEAPLDPPAPAQDVVLLKEIRDLLKTKAQVENNTSNNS